MPSLNSLCTLRTFITVSETISICISQVRIFKDSEPWFQYLRLLRTFLGDPVINLGDLIFRSSSSTCTFSQSSPGWAATGVWGLPVLPLTSTFTTVFCFFTNEWHFSSNWSLWRSLAPGYKDSKMSSQEIIIWERLAPEGRSRKSKAVFLQVQTHSRLWPSLPHGSLCTSELEFTSTGRRALCYGYLNCKTEYWLPLWQGVKSD